VNDNNNGLEQRLSERETQARIDKILLEQEQLRAQLSSSHQFHEKIKTYTGAAGVITAFVALLTLVLTFWQTSENLNISQQGKTAELFDRSLSLLSAERDVQRISGAIAISRFLSKEHPEYHRQALLGLASTMALERNAVVLNTIGDIIGAVTNADVSTDVISAAHRSLIDSNRNILKNNQSIKQSVISFADTKAKFDNCLDFVSDSDDMCEIRTVMKYLGETAIKLIAGGSDVTDFSDTYCAFCDFSELHLEGYDFSRSYLSNANFSSANLAGASFHDSFLVRTDFSGAKLQGAKFTATHDSYVRRNFKNHMGREAVYGPDFRCADLRKADFAGHPVFRFHSAKQQEYFADLGPIFWGSDLEGTDFSKIRIYAVTDKEKAPIENNFWSHPIKLPNEFFYVEWPLQPDAKLRLEKDSPYKPYLQLGFAFRGANWTKASFPDGIKELLEKKPPESDSIACDR
jgi:uncharacterized protein YjbI with pentapeptide repeats